MFFNADFAMQTFSEYIKYDIEECYCPTSSITLRKVHVSMILIEHCYSRSLYQLRVPLLLKENQYNSSFRQVGHDGPSSNYMSF